jgi:glycerol-3-phosphate dehydrogenase
MKREAMLAVAADPGRHWDLLVIGGGATGLGIAVDAAARGHAVLLAERDDFAKGTSSRSTKLIHGGVRYLQQGQLGLVVEALEERGRLCRNAPHLVHRRAFIVPSYAWWESPFYGIGLKLYDLLAGRHGFAPSRHLDRNEVIAALPGIAAAGLSGGTRYIDGQFDDARLAVALAQTAAAKGATLVNYCPVVALRKDDGRVSGAVLRDAETGHEFAVAARVVINATGPFCDEVRRLDNPQAAPLIAPSQGTHLVLPRRFLPGDSALLVPRTADGRIIFIIPWQDRVLVGTTDTPVAQATPEPRAQAAEIDFLLTTANRYLASPISRDDILSVFTGIRPLVSGDGTTASLSREHTLLVDPQSGLLSIAGGKWTTYRRMAEQTVDLAQRLGTLPVRPCPTADLPIAAPGVAEPAPALHPALPLTAGEVRRACREEMARRVEDVLARRSACLLLDAAAAIAIAPTVAGLMADELGRDAAWVEREVAAFTALATGYLPHTPGKIA